MTLNVFQVTNTDRIENHSCYDREKMNEISYLIKSNQGIEIMRLYKEEKNYYKDNFCSFNSLVTVTDHTVLKFRKIFKCDFLNCKKEYVHKYRLEIHQRIHV